MNQIIALAAGFILDFLIGDPRWIYHPVCLIGKLIAALEQVIRKLLPKTEKAELAGGFLEVLLVCALSFGIPFVILRALYRISALAGLLLECFWCCQLLAAKSLKTESMKVYDALKHGTLEEARYAVSMIVGRDTQELSEEGVIKAAVETVAENTSDGIVAPAFYMALGGVPLMFLYKGINTMDSMIAYKNEKYLYSFLRDNELERIDSECGEKVVKYRKFSSSTNRQRAIGYLLYELRELHGEEYDSDLKAIRTVRKYTICGENLLENLVYRTVTTLFLGGIYVSQENVLKNVKYSL